MRNLEEKISKQWNAQIGTKEFLQNLEELETRFDALSNVASPESIEKLQKSLLGNERNESIQKFDFWISLMEDTKLTAEDFEIKESEVAHMVSTFINGKHAFNDGKILETNLGVQLEFDR